MTAVTQVAPPAVQPGTRVRRHLRSVPVGPSAHGGGGHAGVRVQPDGWRLTARGRRLAGVVGVCATLLGGGAAVHAWAAPAAAPRVVTVQAGETLSEVAHRAYPGRPVSDAVTKVALVNHLNSVRVAAGQRLTVPRD